MYFKSFVKLVFIFLCFMAQDTNVFSDMNIVNSEVPDRDNRTNLLEMSKKLLNRRHIKYFLSLPNNHV